MRLFALLCKYYEGFTPEIVNELTLFQFFGFLKEISELESIFSGTESEEEDKGLALDAMAEAEMLGLKPPKVEG